MGRLLYVVAEPLILCSSTTPKTNYLDFASSGLVTSVISDNYISRPATTIFPGFIRLKTDHAGHGQRHTSKETDDAE